MGFHRLRQILIARRAVAVEEEPGTGQLCANNLIYLPLAQSVFLGNTLCSICVALGPVQGTRPPLHDVKMYASPLAPQK